MPELNLKFKIETPLAEKEEIKKILMTYLEGAVKIFNDEYKKNNANVKAKIEELKTNNNN